MAGYGEHLSVPVELDLTGAMRLPTDRAVAFLSLAAVPWPCETYLRLEIADERLWLPVDAAAPLLETLVGLPVLSGTAQDGGSQ